MITMCYKVDLNEYSQNYSSYNEGFIIAKIQGDKLVSLEGLFTCDYLECEICQKEVILKYYKLSENYCYLHPYFEMIIENKNFKLPLRIQSYDDDGMLRQLLTEKICEEQEEIKKCKKEMQDFKMTYLFKTISQFKRK